MALDGTSCAVASWRRPNSPVICFSPVRWQHAGRLRALMSRFARQRDVFFLEEPVRSDAESLRVRPCALTGVQVVTPLLPKDGVQERRLVLDLLLARSGSAIAWYATPEALEFSDHVPWLATVYDCAGQPSALGQILEERLLRSADLVFTASAGLHQQRRDRHPDVHCFPAGIDVDHFAAARGLLPEPKDQIGLRRPLLGRIGPVDDRLDFDLLVRIAGLRPHWHFAMIGPIETARELPRAANIHWLGARDEGVLPRYLSHWDLAILPLTRGAVPDDGEVASYLASGRRVVSTPVTTITRRFGALEAVESAETAEAFVAAAERAMLRTDVSDFVAVDDLLVTLSWDTVQQHMAALLNVAERKAAAPGTPVSRSGPLRALIGVAAR